MIRVAARVRAGPIGDDESGSISARGSRIAATLAVPLVLLVHPGFGARAQAPASDAVPRRTVSEESVLTVGTADGPEETVLVNPLDATILSDGTLIVGMFSSNFFALRFFDPDGRSLRDVGRYGDGPFELSRGFTSLVRLPGDSVLVVGLDMRFMVFGPDGHGVRSGALDVPPAATPVGMVDERRLLFRVPRFERPVWEGDAVPSIELILLDLDTGGTVSLGSERGGRRRLSETGRPLYLPFEPDLRVAAGGGRVWVAPVDGGLRRVDPRGGAALRVELPHPRRPVDGDLRDRWRDAVLARRAGDASSELRAHVGDVEFPESVPQIQRLDVDPEGKLWVMWWEPHWSEAPYHWDVFDPGGRLQAEVTAPFALLGRWPRRLGFSDVRHLLEVGSHHLLVRQRDEWGVDRIGKYEISEDSGR